MMLNHKVPVDRFLAEKATARTTARKVQAPKEMAPAASTTRHPNKQRPLLHQHPLKNIHLQNPQHDTTRHRIQPSHQITIPSTKN